jgi:hypothetical protein
MQFVGWDEDYGVRPIRELFPRITLAGSQSHDAVDPQWVAAVSVDGQPTGRLDRRLKQV